MKAHEKKHAVDANALRHAEKLPVSRWSGALDRVRPACAALPVNELVPVTLDVRACVTTALGVLPKVLPLRAQLVPLPLFHAKDLDHLEDYACALAQAQALLSSTPDPVTELPGLNEKGAALRSLLVDDARPLLNRGLIPAGSLDQLSGLKGYKNVAFDLATIANVLMTAWTNVAGKTAITVEQIIEASDLSHQILVAVGARDGVSESADDLSDLRHRAFSVLVIAYNRIRKNLVYMLDEDKANELMPSLYAGRTSGRRPSDAPEPTGTTPIPPGTAPNGATSPDAGAAGTAEEHPGGAHASLAPADAGKGAGPAGGLRREDGAAFYRLRNAAPGVRNQLRTSPRRAVRDPKD